MSRPQLFAVVLFCCMLLAGLTRGQLSPSAQEGVDLPRQPGDPIVGILSQPNPHHWEQPCDAYVQQDYVDWLAQAGVRSMVIPYDLPFPEMKKLLDQLNGALFTGGMLNTTVPSTFYSAAQYITNYTLQTNKNNDPFVLWGTCQGFQLITMTAANDQRLLQCDYVGTMTSMLPLEMKSDANTSRMFSMLNISSPLLWEDLTTKNSTANGHNCGVLPHVYDRNPILKSDFNVLSTNVDITGKPFVSSVEHKTAEIYAIQWHPEGAQLWYDMGFNKQPSTIRVSQYMANFVVTRLRGNTRKFQNVSDSFVGLLRQYEIVQNPAKQYTGFYCVDVPPTTEPAAAAASSSLTVTQLQDAVAVWRICACAGFAIILALVAALFLTNRGGGSPPDNNRNVQQKSYTSIETGV